MMAAVKHPPGSQDRTVNLAQILRLGPHPQGAFIPNENKAHSIFHRGGPVAERLATGIPVFPLPFFLSFFLPFFILSFLSSFFSFFSFYLSIYLSFITIQHNSFLFLLSTNKNAHKSETRDILAIWPLFLLLSNREIKPYKNCYLPAVK